MNLTQNIEARMHSAGGSPYTITVTVMVAVGSPSLPPVMVSLRLGQSRARAGPGVARGPDFRNSEWQWHLAPPLFFSLLLLATVRYIAVGSSF